MSECRRTTEQLGPYVDGMLSPDERGNVERHLAACPPCRRMADAIDGGRIVLQEARTRLREPMPPGLRSRCEALAYQRLATSSWWRRLGPAVAITLIVVSTLAVLAVLGTERSNMLLAQQLIVDHMKCFLLSRAPSGDAAASAEVERAIDRRYAGNLHVPPSSESAGVTLIGERRCLYASGVIPHVMYRAGGRNLSLFVLDGVSRAQADIVTLGYRARIWSQGGRSYVLIAERADADLNGARYLMEQVH